MGANSIYVIIGADNLWKSGYYYSFDGGATWSGGDQLPGQPEARWCFDPAVAFAADGLLHYHYLDNLDSAFVSTSTDGGVNWRLPKSIPNPGKSDKGHMAVDTWANSPYVHNVYVAWTDFCNWPDPPNPIVFSRSTDRGESFSDPYAISDISGSVLFAQGVNLAAGPGGVLYAVWSVYQSWPSTGDSIGFNISTNGGESFGTPFKIPIEVRGIRGVLKNYKPHWWNVYSFPSMAVDPNNGDIYIVWADSTYGDPDILLTKSTDGGTTWLTPPVRVNNDEIGNGLDQWFPWITVDPSGIVYIVFYDSRNDPDNLLTETWLAYSLDGGEIFDNIQVSDCAYTPVTIQGCKLGYQGDYIGITSTHAHPYVGWADIREPPGHYQAYFADVVLPEFIRGDANGDSVVTMADALVIGNYYYYGGPCSCEDAFDANDSGHISFADALYVKNYYYQTPPGSPPPPYPFPECGPDPTADELDCGCHPPCMGCIPPYPLRLSEFGGDLWLGEATLTQDKLSVPVYLENVKTLAAFTWEVHYDPKLLTAESVDSSGLITEKFEFFGALKDIDKGWVRAGALTSWTLDWVLPPGRYQIATMHFALKTDGVNPTEVLRLGYIELVDPYGNILRAGTSGGPMSSSPIVLPCVFTLLQNRPNPFTTETGIAYSIPKTCQVCLEIYDSSGRLVQTLVNEKKDPGYHTAHWDGKANNGKEVSSGVYFYRIEAGGHQATRKLVRVE